MNDRIRFGAVEQGVPYDDHVSFLCECGDPLCERVVHMTLAEYAARRLDPHGRVLATACRLREESAATVAKSEVLRGTSLARRARLSAAVVATRRALELFVRR